MSDSMSAGDRIRKSVRESYAKVVNEAGEGAGCCGPSNGCCGGDSDETVSRPSSTRLGYSAGDLQAVPEGADLGLGCGNPKAIAALRPGETVLDLGSGAGFDCFLAAREVGPAGRVIGVDMTPAMIERARENAAKAGVAQVEFRLGEIEHLPVGDSSVDVILSNCVINLSPEKRQVFREALRVLKPGGRLAISDIVATATLPPSVKEDLALHSACVAGATPIEELQALLKDAGFEKIRIEPKDESRGFIRDWAPGRGVEEYIVSATIEAVKPQSPVSR